MSGTIVVILFISLLVFKIPIAICMGLPSMIYIIVNNIPLSAVIQRMVASLNSFTLLAIPLFILGAGIMNSSSITERLFDFSKLLVGRLRGGLAHVNVICSLIFAGVSGAALADIGGIGNIEIKAMKEQGYTDEDAAAITAASATIGPIFPPSIPLIIYASAAEVPSMRLLISGVIPALLIAGLLMLDIAYLSKKNNYPRGVEKPFTKPQIFTIIKRGLPSLLMPVIMIVGMLSGFFSPTEVASIAVIYAIILSIVYREISFKRMSEILFEVLESSCSVLFIVAAAAIFAWVLTVEQLPQQLTTLMLGITHNKIILLLLSNVLLLVAGMILETTSAIMILTPILLPLLVLAGVNPIHFGLVMVFNLMIGMLTPPVGMSVYMLSPIVGLSVDKLFKAISRYLIILLICLLILTLVPQISLWLPNHIYG